MHIHFDDTIKIAGIGLVPWTRLGPEQWLSQYKIASLYGWDLSPSTDRPPVLALSDRTAMFELPRLNTASLLKVPEFQKMLKEELPDYSFLTYKPATIPPELAGRRFLMVDPSFTASFENKVAFRRMCADKLVFPPYKIYDRKRLSPTQETYDEIAGGRDVFVLQDEQLSGGKGTFIIRSFADFVAALKSLEILTKHSQVVVSDAIVNPKERSIQGCVTHHGIFTGPLQRQLVREPHLANMQIATGDKWCGAQIYAEDQNTPEHKTAQEAADVIGKMLQAQGYKGIFGVDFLLDADNQLYTIEVNPRITGVTPLLAAAYPGNAGVPFYLLHLLELGDYPYEIEDTSAVFDEEGALLVLHSLENTDVYIESMPPSGTYHFREGKLERVSDNIVLHRLKPGEWIIEEYLPPQMVVHPGGRLLTMQTKESTIDKNSDKLYNETITAISLVRKNIITKVVL